MKDIKEVCTTLQEMVEHVGTGLDPGDDWVPVLICMGDGPNASGIIGMPYLGHPEHKDKMAKEVIPSIISQAKPDFAGLVMMGWSIEYDRSTLEGRAQEARDEAMYKQGNIADRPGKFEVLTIYVVSKTGEERQLLAYVHRHPTLSPTLQWRDDTEGATSEGRFPDALRAGFEAVKTGKVLKPDSFGVQWLRKPKGTE